MARLILVNGRIYSETGTRTVLVNGSIFNATVSAGGGVDVLTADDLRSASQVSSPVLYDLAADDLRSSSQLSSPATGQEHALLADDLRSAPQLSKPTASTIGQDVLTADDLRSASQISSPALALNPPQYAHTRNIFSRYRWTTPSSTASNITGAIDLRVHARLDRWDNNSSQVLFNKYDLDAGGTSWTFYVDSTKKLRYYQTSGGDVSTASIPFADGEEGWVRVTSDDTVDELKFYTSTDGDIWTQLGATITTVTAPPATSTALVEVGTFGKDFPCIGAIYRAQAFEDGVLAVDFNPNEAAVGDSQSWNAVLTGELWSAAEFAFIRSGHALYQDTGLQSGAQLSTPTSGQEHALLADDLRSGTELSTPALGQEHALLADDLRSGSEIATPALGQEHALLADDLRSGTELSTPTATHNHALAADDLRSGSELSTPAIGQTHNFTARQIDTYSQLVGPAGGDRYGYVRESQAPEPRFRAATPGTEGDLQGKIDILVDVRLREWDNGTVQVLLDKGAEWSLFLNGTPGRTGSTLRFWTTSGADSGVPVPYQNGDRGWVRVVSDPVGDTLRFYYGSPATWYQLGADASHVGAPNTTVYPVELGGYFSGGQLPAVGSFYRALIYSDDVVDMAFTPDDAVLGDDQTWISGAGETWTAEPNAFIRDEQRVEIGQTHVLLADDLRSGSQISTPALGQANVLLADDLRSGSELSTPTAGHIHDLAADDLQSGTQVSSPALAHIHVLLADDLQSGPQLSSPLTGDYFQRMVPDSTVGPQSWTNELGSTVDMHLSIDEIPDPDESDWVQSIVNPNFMSGGPIFTLSDVVPTPLADADQTLQFRLALEENTTEPMLFSYTVIEGSSPRVIGDELVTTDVPYTFTHILTQTEKDSIVNYDNLLLQFSAKVN